MKISLLGEDGIRLEPTPGPMTVEAETYEQVYSPYHMLGSSLAFCEYSLLASWASHAGVSADDLAIEVHWTFQERPHQVNAMTLRVEWPSLPAERREAVRHAVTACPVHRTLQHAPAITTELA